MTWGEKKRKPARANAGKTSVVVTTPYALTCGPGHAASLNA